MFNKRAHRVVFAIGILLVLSLAVFGSMIAVAWMSMNNTMIVTSDGYFNEKNAAQTSATLAWRLDPSDMRTIDHRDVVRMIDFQLDPGTVRSIDYKDAVASVDFRLDPGTVRSIDYKDAVRMIDFKDAERTIDQNSLWGIIRLMD
jgi:multisubunit Na+/H+ antiporter MnhE subunit